jgi:hypothetical protein
MSFQVYAMWVFRIEFPAVRANRKKRPDFVDIEFAPEYSLAVTHMQRIATEFRVPRLLNATQQRGFGDSCHVQADSSQAHRRRAR